MLFLAVLGGAGGGGGGGGVGADCGLRSAESRWPASASSAVDSRSTSYLPVPRYGSGECSWMVASRQLPDGRTAGGGVRAGCSWPVRVDTYLQRWWELAEINNYLTICV